MPRKKKKKKKSVIPDQNNNWTVYIYPSLCPFAPKWRFFIKSQRELLPAFDNLKPGHTFAHSVFWPASKKSSNAGMSSPANRPPSNAFPTTTHACCGWFFTSLSLHSDCPDTNSTAAQRGKLLCQLLWSLQGVGTARLIYSPIHSTPRSLEVTVRSMWDFELQALSRHCKKKPVQAVVQTSWPAAGQYVGVWMSMLWLEASASRLLNCFLLSSHVSLIRSSKPKKISSTHDNRNVNAH